MSGDSPPLHPQYRHSTDVVRSWLSLTNFTGNNSTNDDGGSSLSGTEIVPDEYSVNVDVEARVERVCRICQLRLDDQESVELACSCKGDLATAHKQCAEKWFKIKGNTTCEICRSIARNVDVEVGEELNELLVSPSSAGGTTGSTETQHFWQRDFLFYNRLLTSIALIFIIVWIIGFNAP